MSSEDGARLFRLLYDPGDFVSIVPLVSSDDKNGKKNTRQPKGFYRSTFQMPAIDEDHRLLSKLNGLNDDAARHMASLYFGVCPRFGARSGNKSSYDLAFQVRKVPCVWVDIDHTAYDVVRSKIKDREVPIPTAAVSSGYGFHLYWVFRERFILDDYEGDPPPIVSVWNADRKQLDKYYELAGERVYITGARGMPPLSPKAEFIQQINDGLAKLLDADRVKDVSRLLRIPGTMNRKNQPNGTEPRPCKLQFFDPSIRYSPEDFDSIAKLADRKEQEAIRKTVLPPPNSRNLRKTKTEERFRELLNLCIQADVGERSETDFAFCAFCVEHGIPQSEAFNALAEVGKTGERGEGYFAYTWTAAIEKAKEVTYRKLQEKKQRKSSRPLSDHREILERSKQGENPDQDHTDNREGIGESTGQSDDDDAYMQFCEFIANRLQIEVIGEYEDGSVKVYSKPYGKMSCFKLRNWGYNELGQLIPPKIRNNVVNPPESTEIETAEDGMPKFPMTKIKDVVANLAGRWRIEDGCERGIGCWNHAEGVMIVGPDEAALWTGSELVRVDRPRVGEFVIDFTGKRDQRWFDYGELSNAFQDARQPGGTAKVVEQLRSYFGQFCWRRPTDALLVSGLALATWVQELWLFRPLVAIKGDSNSGKSTLSLALKSLYGGLAIKASGSTFAGIQQAIGNSSRIILEDELDKNKHRKTIIERFRSSTSGDDSLRGSVDHTHRSLRLMNLAWFFGITMSLEDQADLNRFLAVSLAKITSEKAFDDTSKGVDFLRSIRLRTLATAVTCIGKAEKISREAARIDYPGIEKRIVECHAVPAAMLAVATGEDVRTFLGLFMASYVEHDGETAEDIVQSGQILDSILSHVVKVRTDDHRQVSAIVNAINAEPETQSSRDLKLVLSNHGIAVIGERVPFDRKDQELRGIRRCVAFHPPSIWSQIVRHTRFSDMTPREIRDHLLTIEGTKMKAAGFPLHSGQATKKCVIVPFDEITEGTTEPYYPGEDSGEFE